MKKRSKKWLLILTIVTILFFLVGGVEYIRNNIICDLYANQLYSLSLPPNTKIISKNKDLGLLAGNGNHLDFMAFIEVESALSKEELEEYYKDKKVKSANQVSRFFKPPKPDGEYGNDEIHFEQVDITVFSKNKAKMLPDNIYHETKNIDSTVGDNLFIIQIKDVGYPPGRDIRAH